MGKHDNHIHTQRAGTASDSEFRASRYAKPQGDDPAYFYYSLNDIREMDAKITQAANTLQSDEASAGEKANARRILERFKKEYSTASL